MSFIKRYSKPNDLVAYVGDGANDTAAFHKADISLALGNFELCISAAFVSKAENISHIIELIKEGRAALYNGMLNFRYIIFMQINQFISQIILSTRYIGLNLHQSYFMDIFIFTLLSLMLNDFEASDELSQYRPHSNIFNKQTVITLALLISATIISIIISIVIFTDFDGYVSPIERVPESQKLEGSMGTDTIAYFDNHFLFWPVFSLNNLLFLH